MVKNLLNLFFPKVCYACSNVLSDNEIDICTNCRHNLPITNYHFNDSKIIQQLLYGRVNIEQGTALFTFQKKGIVQHLLHNLKYKGHEHISSILGDWLGNELATLSAYQSVDIVIPVPLHKVKKRKRGYNQVSKFAIQIAKALNAEFIDTVLLKTSATTTQVFKQRISRWNNAQEVFSIQNKHLIENKHILLVDDIITTGATIEACAVKLNQAHNIKISIATMAIAQ